MKPAQSWISLWAKAAPPLQKTIRGVTYNLLGIHGAMSIVHTIGEMGAGGVGASQQRTREAIDHWKPAAVVAVGIAFGLDETKQKIGDVLVATQIQDYELGRINNDGRVTPRGDKPHTSDTLSNRLRQTDTTQIRTANDWPKVRFGLVLSGQKLVDNLDYRESLKALHPESIGGEMEGTGLYVSATAAKIDWILIKAICDWGHEKNQADKDAWQRLAALNAVRVLKTALDVGCLYSTESNSLQIGIMKDEEAGAEHAVRDGQRGVMFDADISRIVKYAPERLIGREDELKLVSDAWDKAVRGETKRPHVLTFVALGGEGKTSLVAKWAADLAHKDWPGCEAAFAWSFYSQGTREQLAASSDLFLKEALNFFGDDSDKQFAASNAGAFEKGQRLARIVGQKCNLLILDGLEPLQYAPTSPTAGELKDGGLAALLKGLATTSHGLCIVTTRYSVADLKAFKEKTVMEKELNRLSREAGVNLLQSLRVAGSLLRNIRFGREFVNEYEKLVEDVRGHALTLNLLGTYLRDAHGGDIRRRDLVRLSEADAEEQSGHAFRVMEAYERALEDEGDRGKRALAILRLLGLFDRPMTSDCMAALLQEPAIVNLTEMLVGITDAPFNIALSRLQAAKLITVNRDAAGALVSLDAHPLLREYFARRLQAEQTEAWRVAHRRLYEHLCETTKEGDEPTLEDLQPLYQAVAHGCQAGLQQEACDEVYYARILRGQQYYSSKNLGLMGSNVGAVACFFDVAWSSVAPTLTESDQAWLLNEAAYYLRALGRISEAIEPIRAGLANYLKREDWKNAAILGFNLSELELTLGETLVAMGDGGQSVTFADRSGDAFWKMGTRTAYADVLHQGGQPAEAESRFVEAGEIQARDEPTHRLLYGVAGFRYCDLLLAVPERAAWVVTLESGDLPSSSSLSELPPSENGQIPSGKRGDKSRHSQALRAVSQRAAQTLSIAELRNWPLDIGLDHLTLGRAALEEAILEKSQIRNPKSEIDRALESLRRANSMDHIPRGLLSRAWLRFLEDDIEGAQTDLDEAWEIAERGPMRLHMADIHLYRARLFHAVKPYPWNKNPDGTERGPKDDLAAAKKLIEDCGYGRRKEELEDAEAAAKNW